MARLKKKKKSSDFYHMVLHLLHLLNKLCICIVTCSPTFNGLRATVL